MGSEIFFRRSLPLRSLGFRCIPVAAGGHTNDAKASVFARYSASMASISTNAKGITRILFTAPDGRRKAIHAGRISNPYSIKQYIELISESFTTGKLDAKATKWLRVIPDRFHAKLCRAGLASPRGLKRSKHQSARSVVYFIQEGDSGPIKIGFTAGRVGSRLSALQSAHSRPLRIIGTIPGDCGTEIDLHFRFSGHHIRGEWFQPSDELLVFIKANCQ